MKRRSSVFAVLLALCMVCLLSLTANAAVKNGWNAKKTSYFKNGKKVTGLVTIAKKKYYFNAKGILVTNKAPYKAKINGKVRYFDITKKGVATEWKGTAAMAAKRIYALKANLSNPTASKREKALLKCFTWSADGIKYRGEGEIDTSKSAADKYGQIAFVNKKGDCATSAYAFYWMAKVLGYKNAKVIVGYIPGKVSTENGERVFSDFEEYIWVEIKIGSKVYGFDPTLNKKKSDGKYLRDTNGKGKKYAFKFRYQNSDDKIFAYHDKSKKLISR